MSWSTDGQDIVAGDEHRNVLRNFRIAHEKVEEQRKQLEEQERQVAELRLRIRTLEGDNQEKALNGAATRRGGQSVDDFSIKNAASKLEKQISRYAASVINTPPTDLNTLRRAAFLDLLERDVGEGEATPMHVQNLLRHALAETITEEIINCLIITNSPEANVQLTRIHEHLFSRDPTVACVWRRQTFSAAVESCSPEMSTRLLTEHLPFLFDFLSTHERTAPSGLSAILDSAYAFSRMLHAFKAGGAVIDTFYRAFVPELGTTLDAAQMELTKRCAMTERGEMDRVGACVFPGLVKVTGVQQGGKQERSQLVVKRALVVCECAMGLGGPPPLPQFPAMGMGGYPIPAGLPTFQQASSMSSPTMSHSSLTSGTMSTY